MATSPVSDSQRPPKTCQTCEPKSRLKMKIPSLLMKTAIGLIGALILVCICIPACIFFGTLWQKTSSVPGGVRWQRAPRSRARARCMKQASPATATA